MSKIHNLIDTLRIEFTHYIESRGDISSKGYYANSSGLKHGNIFISVPKNNPRDMNLTVARIQNVIATINRLSKLKSDKNCSDENMLFLIKDILNEGQTANNKISCDYYKSHRSYKQNLSLRSNSIIGALAAWWNKTWFQSGANKAYESCTDLVDSFEKIEEKSQQRSPAYNPSSFTTSK